MNEINIITKIINTAKVTLLTIEIIAKDWLVITRIKLEGGVILRSNLAFFASKSRLFCSSVVVK
ncbi:hypothetical protein [Mesomycoplasma ovipneumoniae]|uniref:hypothetical protein n=1 Tax=Mesomycoplasma ovipneumoniae TaxID=29562 RepID=UPI0030803358